MWAAASRSCFAQRLVAFNKRCREMLTVEAMNEKKKSVAAVALGHVLRAVR